MSISEWWLAPYLFKAALGCPIRQICYEWGHRGAQPCIFRLLKAFDALIILSSHLFRASLAILLQTSWPPEA